MMFEVAERTSRARNATKGRQRTSQVVQMAIPSRLSVVQSGQDHMPGTCDTWLASPPSKRPAPPVNELPLPLRPRPPLPSTQATGAHQAHVQLIMVLQLEQH